MIWGYRFSDVEEHLGVLGFRRVRLVDGNVLHRRGDQVSTIREPDELGSLPENIVLDAFDNAELPPPASASGYLD